jgi:hypothetical protein
MLSNPKAQRGHSKEKRSDCKLLTLALIIDEQGFPKYSKLYPGNQSDKYNREISKLFLLIFFRKIKEKNIILDYLALLNLLIMIFIKNWLLSLTELKLKGIFIKNL